MLSVVGTKRLSSVCEWEIWDFVCNTTCLIALNRKRIGKTMVEGAGRVGRHVSSRRIPSSCQTSHTFSLSILSPPKRNSACCKCGQDFQNTYTLEPLNFKPVCPDFAAKLHKSIIWTIKGWASVECWPRCRRLTPSSQLLTVKGRGPHTMPAVKQTSWGTWFSTRSYLTPVPCYVGNTPLWRFHCSSSRDRSVKGGKHYDRGLLELTPFS